ncbi:hypothetical protein E2C01_009786 [Portunus trituberculatus]|uniref:Uncharacterized protein n=1 Tax=Portunus trituberculatus TaxID=210409 RepID=A0A5B7D6P8_PORTR|nr:hypothetical protein [Portunus trituberculatus]
MPSSRPDLASISCVSELPSRGSIGGKDCSSIAIWVLIDHPDGIIQSIHTGEMTGPKSAPASCPAFTFRFLERSASSGNHLADSPTKMAVLKAIHLNTCPT